MTMHIFLVIGWFQLPQMMCTYFFIVWPISPYLKLALLTLSIFLKGYKKRRYEKLKEAVKSDIELAFSE
jgi:hypothetical protein